MNLPELKVGVFPPPLEEFVPEHWQTQVALLTGAISTLTIADFLFPGEPVAQASVAAIAITSGWLFDRWNTRHQRDGFLFDAPFALIQQPKQAGANHANWEVTDLLRTRTGMADLIVTETRSHQFRIFKIPNLDPRKIEAQLPAISMLLGTKEDMLIWDQNHNPGESAIITPIQTEADWKPVAFKADAIIKGKLHSYIGASITGADVVLDRGIYPHMLVTGMTGAGKTEAFCADIASMRATGMAVNIIIIDPKNTAQLKRQHPDFYTSDIDQGIDKLESVFAIAQERMERYSNAGCDNFIEYRQKVDSNEPLICIYIDEIAAFLRKNMVEELEKGDKPRHARAFNILTTFLEQVRSSGVLLTAGVQTAKATNVPTDVRDHFGAKLIFATADANAGRTAGESEASALPMQGGFILKTGRKTTLGRGAYLKA